VEDYILVGHIAVIRLTQTCFIQRYGGSRADRVSDPECVLGPSTAWITFAVAVEIRLEDFVEVQEFLVVPWWRHLSEDTQRRAA